MTQKTWFVYILSTDRGSFYTGITTDVERRFSEHQHSSKKGAKFFRTCKPVAIVFQKECQNRSEAGQLEARIKKMSHAEKAQLGQALL